MNELQRQHYLSSLGIETYMPRWQLPFAPRSMQCEVPSFVAPVVAFTELTHQIRDEESKSIDVNHHQVTHLASSNTSPLNHVIDTIVETKTSIKSSSAPATIATILKQLDDKPKAIEPFSLSVLRPFGGLLVLDSRQAKLALPTEKLFQQMMKALFPGVSLSFRDEVMRWPMIENSFAKRTLTDARAEMQTWLSVQQEIHDVKYLWLMGENAATYLMKDEMDFSAAEYQAVRVGDQPVKALILPSLTELLKMPAKKKNVFVAINRYQRGKL